MAPSMFVLTGFDSTPIILDYNIIIKVAHPTF